MKKVILLLTFAVVLASTLWFGINPFLSKKIHAQSEETFLSATVLKPTQPLGQFSLIDNNGQPFQNLSLKGHWTLLYFGYATCPDVCPRTLNTVSELYGVFADQRQDFKPRFIFASLDPKEDAPEKLAAFLKRFHPEFQGITGDEDEIQKLTKSCRVYSWTDPKPNAAGQKVIDHSAALMLINPHGQLTAIFSPPHSPQNIYKDLQILMKN